MIVRIVLALDNDVLRKELHGLLPQPGVIVETVDKRHLLWEHISKGSGDVIIVGRSLVPSAEEMQILRELPESPWVIVTLERPDADEETAFLAAGCDAVLSSALPRDALADALMQYSRPGNVWELINVVERALILCEEEQIGLHDLPESICMAAPSGGPLDLSLATFRSAFARGQANRD